MDRSFGKKEEVHFPTEQIEQFQKRQTEERCLEAAELLRKVNQLIVTGRCLKDWENGEWCDIDGNGINDQYDGRDVFPGYLVSSSHARALREGASRILTKNPSCSKNEELQIQSSMMKESLDKADKVRIEADKFRAWQEQNKK